MAKTSWNTICRSCGIQDKVGNSRLPNGKPDAVTVFGTDPAANTGNMGYRGTCRDPEPMAAEIQRRFWSPLNARFDAAGPVESHRPSGSDSLFQRRPDYAVPFGPYGRFARKLSSVLAALLFSISSAAQATIRNAASPSLADVTAAINLSVDGDTVIVPAGSATWTSGLTITKSIEVIGQTTTNPVAKTANDQTIITDSVKGIAITIAPAAGKTVRVSGFSFRPGSNDPASNSYTAAVAFSGGSSTGNGRLDHCHFIPLNRIVQIAWYSQTYGVADHNVLDFPSGFLQSFIIRMGNWGNNSLGIGDGSFADYPYFGTEKFAFIEDNCINNTSGSSLNGLIDSDFGGRFVFRYNHCYDILLGSHGSEGRWRGMRACEIYNNDFHNTVVNYVGGLRSGAGIIHDNTFDGIPLTGQMNLQNYRTFFLFPGNTLGSSSGDGPWDVNVTESDGVTHIDGHAPYLFASGTVTSGTTTTLTDTSKSWTTNQWAGYTAKRVSDNGIMSIISNTSNTLTGYYRPDQGGGVTWAAGNSYQIHRVAISLDQPCRGKGTLIVGEPPQGTPAWPNEALEPCFSWNNKYTPNNSNVAQFVYGDGMYNKLLFVAGRDYYNDSSSGTMTAKYTASLNGVAYTGPYTYPHPLVGGSPPPTPTPTPEAPSPPTDLKVVPP